MLRLIVDNDTPLDSKTSDEWYNEGLDLDNGGSATEAMLAYQRAIQTDSTNADACVNLGRLHQLNGEDAEAIRLYKTAIDIDNEHDLAYYNLGTILDEQGHLKMAVACYIQAPSISDAQYNMERIKEKDETIIVAALAELAVLREDMQLCRIAEAVDNSYLDALGEENAPTPEEMEELREGFDVWFDNSPEAIDEWTELRAKQMCEGDED